MLPSSLSPTIMITNRGTLVGSVYFTSPTFNDFSSDSGSSGNRDYVTTLSENMAVELKGRTIISRYLATLIVEKGEVISGRTDIKIKRSVVDIVIGSEKPGAKASLSLENLALHRQATSLDTCQKLFRLETMKHLGNYHPSFRQCLLDQDSGTFIVCDTFENYPRPLKEEYADRIYPALSDIMESSIDFPDTIEML